MENIKFVLFEWVNRFTANIRLIVEVAIPMATSSRLLM